MSRYTYNMSNKMGGVKVVKIPKPRSAGEELLAQQLRAYDIKFEREVKFHPSRKWRIDFVIGDLAAEVEGGIYNGGAHTRGSHFESDAIKYAEALLAGYRVVRFSTGQIKDGTAIDYIRKLIAK